MILTNTELLLLGHITVLIALIRQESPSQEMKQQAINDAVNDSLRIKEQKSLTTKGY